MRLRPHGGSFMPGYPTLAHRPDAGLFLVYPYALKVAGYIFALLPIYRALPPQSLYHAHAGIGPTWLLPGRRFPARRALHRPVLPVALVLSRRSVPQRLPPLLPRRDPAV